MFRPSGPRDPDGSKLQTMLGTHLGWQHAASRRRLLAHVVAAVSVPVGVAAARSDWLSPSIRSAALSVWVLCLAGLLVAAWSERRWRKRSARALADLGPPAAP